MYQNISTHNSLLANIFFWGCCSFYIPFILTLNLHRKKYHVNALKTLLTIFFHFQICEDLECKKISQFTEAEINLRSWRCILLKPLWRAFSNRLISVHIRIAMEIHIILITVMGLRCRLECQCQWLHLVCLMVLMLLASLIKVCGVNIVSNLVSFLYLFI